MPPKETAVWSREKIGLSDFLSFFCTGKNSQNSACINYGKVYLSFCSFSSILMATK